MAPHVGFDPDSIKQKARKDLLHLLEGVSKAARSSVVLPPDQRSQLTFLQVRGKKNLILEKDLAGPIGLFVNFSTLQDYGVDKVFFLENGNADTSQRNVVFIARGEMARHAQSIAGMYYIHKLSF
jgi:vacuolar protein sorting-associated protein 33A